MAVCTNPKPKVTLVPSVRRALLCGTVILAMAALILICAAARVRTDSVYVCEITGSLKHRITWLGLIHRTSYEASPVEDFVQSEYPGALRHKWVWIGARTENLFGRAMQLADGFRKTSLLADFVRSGTFARLSDTDKKTFYDILEWSCTALSDDEKSTMYSVLLNADDNAIRGFIEDYSRKSGRAPRVQRQQNK